MTKKARFFEELAVEVAAGSTVREGAKKVGCNETTAYRLNAMVEFRARVNEIRAEITAGIVGELTASARKAVATLTQLLRDEDPSIQLQAAKAILATIGPLSELGELRQRLDALEKADSKLRIAK